MAKGYQGKRVGSRKAKRAPFRLRPGLILVAVGITVALVAWGYLVLTAIDFGAEARGGDSQSWLFLALAAVGACACLFIALLLIARLTRTLAVTSTASSRSPSRTLQLMDQDTSPQGRVEILDEPPHSRGGHRAS